MKIKTYIRRQYSRSDLGTLGYVDNAAWTIDELPRWMPLGCCPLLWEGEFVGTAEDPEVVDYLAPLFRRHAATIPDGCNHVSVLTHQVDESDLPRGIREACEAIRSTG